MKSNYLSRIDGDKRSIPRKRILSRRETIDVLDNWKMSWAEIHLQWWSYAESWMICYEDKNLTISVNVKKARCLQFKDQEMMTKQIKSLTKISAYDMPGEGCTHAKFVLRAW